VRRIGPIEIAVVNAGSLHFNPGFHEGADWVTPETPVDDEGRAVIGINGMCIRTPEATVLVDPSTWSAEDSLGPHVHLIPGPSLDDALAELGVGAEAVTHVLISHGHHDHFTGLTDPGDAGRPRFPNAEHLFPAADWASLVERDERGQAELLLHYLAPAEAAGKLRLVEGDIEVTPGVTLLHAPGETDGHQIVRVASGDERVYYLGDLIHFPVEIDHLDWVGLRNRDADVLEAARRRVLADAAGKRATFVFTHGQFPGWGMVEQAGPDAWRWRYEQYADLPA
jgi:glyoxylase-like metal-dependent hydrolase (beta-lactamase superfamily II)